MKTVLKGLTMAALLAVVATPAHAQQKSWGFGLFGSWISPGSLAEAEPSDNDLKLDDGWSGGGSLEKWFGSRRVGLRLEGNYMKQPFILTQGENQLDDDLLNEEEEEVLARFTGIPTTFADASLMLRLLPATVDRRFAPFVSVGTGLVHWDLPDPESGSERATFNRADAYIYGESQTEWALTGGIGTDIFFTESVALRLEAKDYWNSDSPFLVLSDQERDHEGGHNVIWRAGLQFNFGGARVEEPGFVAAPPAPAPRPAPVVAAPAPPATETVAMCVVDANGRLQTVQAKRYIETGQIYVTRNGQEVAFSTVYPVAEPNYIRSSNWYVASRPLILNLDEDDMGGDIDDELDDALEQPENRVEFVNFGSRAPLVMGDVMYVGSIDGTPLYAKISDVGALRTDLNNRLATTTDLGDILDDEEFADRFVNEIETFYLTVEPAARDCIFQPVSSTRVVRRTAG